MTSSYYIFDKYGGKFWYRYHNVLHNENGPAREEANFTGWYINGRLHRLDGPSSFFHSEPLGGKKTWCINGFNYNTKREFQKARTAYLKEIHQRRKKNTNDPNIL